MEDESDTETFNDDSDLAFDFAEANIPERSKAEAFNRETCGCTLPEKGKSCSSTITKEEFIHCQKNCTELTLTELDMVLLGTIHSCINCSDMSISGRKETIWKRIRTPFFYHEKRICRQTFLFLHRIRQQTFYSLFRHYKKNGLSVHMHGNKKRLPSSTTSHETIKEVVKFIINVAEDQALLLPGLVPGFK